MLPENLPQILRDAGLKVVELDGWKTRKRPGAFAPVGVLCHHTATGPSTSNASTNSLLVRGRSDLPGPLCQIGLSRDGTVYLVARGRANHAGKARASGTVAAGDGNALYIGIEAFNDGRGERWPAAQYDAYVKLAATLCVKVTGNSAQTVRGHKESSVTGKIDPTFDMNAFRVRVDAEMRAMRSTPPPKPKPAKVHKPGERVLKVTNPRTSGSDVLWVQSREFFRLKRDGVYGVKTRAAVRRFQMRHNARVWRALGKKVHGHGLIEAKGVVGPRTWDLLEQATDRFKK